MSDEEDEHSAESEAELALKKRREAQKAPSGKGLNDSEKELLQSNKKEREKMSDEINELRKRNEKRKKEREVEEKRLAAERVAEDERRKAAEEEKKRKKEEEEEKKRKDRASKSEQFEKLKNPAKPNFVISKKAGEGAEEEEEEHLPKKSREQLDAEKKAILGQRIEKLSIDGYDQSKLADKAKELHKLIYRLEGEKYDYEKRFKGQQVDMMELAERARQVHKVGRSGLKRVQVSSDDVDIVQAKYSGAPAKIMMYSKYERQKDKRPYKDRKTLYTGPIWGTAAARIKPQKIVKWSEEGLPSYEELPAETAVKE